jgi:hypothetical protein
MVDSTIPTIEEPTLRHGYPWQTFWARIANLANDFADTLRLYIPNGSGTGLLVSAWEGPNGVEAKGVAVDGGLPGVIR